MTDSSASDETKTSCPGGCCGKCSNKQLPLADENHQFLGAVMTPETVLVQAFYSKLRQPEDTDAGQ